MAVSFELPGELESSLRRNIHDLDETVKEAALIELYRQGKLTQRELSTALGISRLQLEGVLKAHCVTEDLPSVEEIQQDVENLRRILNR